MAIRYAAYNDTMPTRWKGLWASYTTYNMTDIVYFAGGLYSCVVAPCSGEAPSGSGKWTLMADGSRTSPYPILTLTGMVAGDELRIAGQATKNTRISQSAGDNVQMVLTANSTTVSFTNNGVAIADPRTVVAQYDMIGNEDIGYFSANTVTPSSCAISKPWNGMSQSVPVYKLNVYKVTQTVGHYLITVGQTSGNPSSPIKVSGGWNLSLSTPTQGYYTIFSQAYGVTYSSYGIFVFNASWVDVSSLMFVRYQYPVYASVLNDSTVRDITAENCTYGIYMAGGNRTVISNITATRGTTTGIYIGDKCSQFRVSGCSVYYHNIALSLRGSNCEVRDFYSTKNTYDIQPTGTAHSRVLGFVSTSANYVFDANDTYDCLFRVNVVTPGTGGPTWQATFSGCRQTRVYFTGTPIAIRCINYLNNTCDNVFSGHSAITTQDHGLYPGSASEYTAIDSSGKATITKMHGVCAQVDVSDINEVTQHSPKARVWKLTPNTNTRVGYPLAMRVARVEVAAGKPVRAAIWMKRSAQDNRICGSLACVSDATGIDFVESILPDPQASPVNKNDFTKLILTVTPAQRGVITFDVRSWLSGDLTSGSLYIDGFSVRQ